MARFPQITAVLAVVALSSSSIVKPPSSDGKNFELLILHNNDMHARFEQTSQLSGACTVVDREAGKCYGGFPRVAHVVKEARNAAASGEGPPVLYLNAGDTYTGTAWFTIYKWKIAAEFLNALQPDAVSLGANDIEKGSNNLTPFLKNLHSPILASNVIINSEEAKQKIKKSTVLNINGEKVGLVGYSTPMSSLLDSTDNIEYIDEVIAVQDEVNKLKKEGIKMIIALGEAEIEKVMEIAAEVDGIDLVITGHKNIFFSNGTNAEIDFENAIKPIVISQKSGKDVPIIQSFAYNKYLGKIVLAFNADGEIVNYKVDSILLDITIPQNMELSEIITKSIDVTAFSEAIGTTVVTLDGETCSVEECNFGNLVADSAILYYAARYTGENWSDAPIAIINGGALTGSITPNVRPFPITRADIHLSIPETTNLVAVTMNGTILNQVLEHSVSDYELTEPSGRFLQFSGIRATYNVSAESGSRLVNAVARCWNCFVPQFFTIDDWRDYKILMPSSLADGGYGYSMLVGLPKEELNFDAVTCTTEYIQMKSPIYPDVAERVVLLQEQVPVTGSATALSSTVILFALTLLPFLFN